MTIQKDAADALLSLNEYPHAPAALMARFEGRRISQLTTSECRSLIRSIKWFVDRLANYRKEFQ